MDRIVFGPEYGPLSTSGLRPVDPASVTPDPVELPTGATVTGTGSALPAPSWLRRLLIVGRPVRRRRRRR